VHNKLIIMGVQGSGKGTQAKLLQEKYELVHISVGDIFRWNIQNHTKLGARILRYVTTGLLVPDELVEEVMKARLEQHDWNYGFILDGFPRNREQAEFFLESYNIDAVVVIDIGDQVVMERMLARRLCASCGLDYNLIYHRPKQDGICDVCGGALKTRPDDNPEAIKSRLADYHDKTEPVVDLFRGKRLVITVDGTKAPPAIHDEICAHLEVVHPHPMER
jgi:adenylate kinase